jgi:hypothetical protein
MAISEITTGVQAVTTTGAVTGTLSTSSLSGDFTLFMNIQGLAAGDTAKFSIQDTENSSEFSDALDVVIADVVGGSTVEGSTYSWRAYQVPSMRYGAAHCELRVNCLAISAGTANVIAWLQQG